MPSGERAEVGWRLPAEWEPHRATWLAWPHNRATWPGVHDSIPPVWVEMIRVLRRHEAVRVLVPDRETERRIRAEYDLGEGRDVDLHVVPTDDAWVRDFAPLFTVDTGGRLQARVFRFDSWGGKYPCERDAVAGARIAELAGVDAIAVDVVLEGGSIDTDGCGRFLTTESCLLDAGRNDGLTRADIEGVLGETLGARQVDWLRQGIVGDDTDGHVDALTRFVAPGVVITAVQSDSADPNHRPLRENLELLRSAEGDLRVVELPMPPAVLHGSVRCPASHLNFYIGNGSVLVPTFRSPSDQVALAILAELFHDRDIVGIDCTNLVLGLGALHCVTMQEPSPETAP